MRRRQRLRTLLRAEGGRLVERGELESADDVFWLREGVLGDCADVILVVPSLEPSRAFVSRAWPAWSRR